MTIYEPKQARRELANIKTIQSAVEAKTPTISRISHTFGLEKTEAFVKLWLVDLSISLGVKNPLSAVQIDDIAYYVANDFRNLTVADFHVIFSDAKKGVYGSMYESLSTDKVLSWIGKYNEKRLGVCAEISRKKHAQLKESPHTERNSELTVKNYLNNRK